MLWAIKKIRSNVGFVGCRTCVRFSRHCRHSLATALIQSSSFSFLSIFGAPLVLSFPYHQIGLSIKDKRVFQQKLSVDHRHCLGLNNIWLYLSNQHCFFARPGLVWAASHCSKWSWLILVTGTQFMSFSAVWTICSMWSGRVSLRGSLTDNPSRVMLTCKKKH